MRIILGFLICKEEIYMKVISVLNNSALVASDKSGIEYVLIGKEML